MKMEQQVVSVELAKRLKELGVEQDSHFKYCGGHTMYHDNEDGQFEDCDNPELLDDDEYCHTAGLTCEFLVAAFTVAELGYMLPEGAHSGRADSIVKEMPPLFFCRLPKPIKDEWHQEIECTEANARAKMLIYLLENKLITV